MKPEKGQDKDDHTFVISVGEGIPHSQKIARWQNTVFVSGLV